MTIVAFVATGCQSIGPRGGSQPTIQAQVDAASPDSIVGEYINTSDLNDISDGDRRLAREAHFKALSASSAGQPIVWRNTSTGTYGQVTPGQQYSVNGLNCRDFAHIVFVGANSSEKKGTACQQSNGAWQILSS